MTVSLCPHFKIFKKTYIKPREGKPYFLYAIISISKTGK